MYKLKEASWNQIQNYATSLVSKDTERGYFYINKEQKVLLSTNARY